jgi:recombinational DNA repair protein (RecF pathway)
MHRSEELELVSCAGCGAEISLRGDRVFSFGSDSALCAECSLQRGGRYDAVHECWEISPRVSDLAQEES